MPELRFEVLGPVRAWHGSSELELGSPQQRAVLAMLLLARGRHVPLDMLIDALWGEEPPRAAASTVRTYLSRLRRCLDGGPAGPDHDVITLVGDGYMLPLGSALVDLGVFEELTRKARAARLSDGPARAAALFREALGLWHGTALAGAPGPYMDSQRVRLAELRAAAEEDGLAADVDSGGHLAAVPQLGELLMAYPLREKLTELLMLALYRSGRQADALAVFDSSRRLLRDELGIDPGPSLQDMQKRILQADCGLLQDGAAPAAKPAISSLLPPALDDFTGRASELSAIVKALTRVPAAVVVISGMPGIGKTALAVRAARAVQPEFPDGQLFAELTDPDSTAAEPAAVLAGFLRALGMTAIPETLFERATAWHAALAGRRVIIVLDDVSSRAQVRRLLPPPPGCAIIVTSQRSAMDLPGARCIEISRLRASEALALLSRLAGAKRVAAEPAAAERLVAACACQPLAVRTVGMRLASRPTWQIEVMDRQLRAELANPTSVHVGCELMDIPFESAHGRLSPDAARAFRQASVGDGLEISVTALSAALNLPEHVIRRLLDSLADVHLIEADAASGGFRYDPLIKLYAWRKALAEDAPPPGRRARHPYAGGRRARRSPSPPAGAPVPREPSLAWPAVPA
jgi:DNA-binding SARP family transcriptional activator